MESEKKFLSEVSNSPIREISIYSASGDLSKKWFVYYYQHVGAGVRRRIRVYDTINQFATAAGRMDRALELVHLIRNGEKVGTSGGPAKRKINDLAILLKKMLSEKSFSLRRKSFLTYSSQIKIFSAWCKFNNVLKVSDFDSKKARAFLDYLLTCGHAGTTVNNYRKNMQSMFGNLKAAGMISENAFEKIPRYQEERQGSYYFKPEQVQKLKAAISEKSTALWLACQFMYYCFIRPGELRNLKVKDVYPDDSKILLRSAISKNKKSEFVSIPTAFVPVIDAMQLHKYPDDYYLIGRDGIPAIEQVSTSFFGKKHLKILREMGFRTGYNLYSWKHTGVVMAHKSGVTVKELKDQLRHHSLDMVAIYLKSMGLDDFGNLRKKFPGL